MATDPTTQDQQVADRPGQTAPVPMPPGLQSTPTTTPDQFSGWNKLYVKQGEPVPAGWEHLVAPTDTEPTQTMLTPDGSKVGEVPVSKVPQARADGNHLAAPMKSPEGKTGWIPYHQVVNAIRDGYQHWEEMAPKVANQLSNLTSVGLIPAFAKTPRGKEMESQLNDEIQSTIHDPEKRAKFMVGLVQPQTEFGLGTEEAISELMRGAMKKLPEPAAPAPEAAVPRTIDVQQTAPGKYEPTSPADIVKSTGMVYKGELSPGSGVHMVEHPNHPGKTGAVEEPVTPEKVTSAVDRVLTRFGVNPGEPETARETLTRQGAAQAKPEVQVPPETTTGKYDAAIKQAGAIPGGITKGDDVEPDMVNFHDSKTGSTMGLPVDQVTPERVTQELEKTRAQFAPSESEMLEEQTPLKQPYKVNISNQDGTQQTQTISAFSTKAAIKEAKKNFPDARSWGIEYGATQIAQQANAMMHDPNYVVPTGKPLSMPPSISGKSEQATINHELGHLMIGQRDGLTQLGMKRHTHPDLAKYHGGARAAATFKAAGMYTAQGIANLVPMHMGGIAMDEIGGIPRTENLNFDRTRPGGDAHTAFTMLTRAGYTPERAMEIMNQAIDSNKEYLTNPAVKSVIDENAPVREKGLSTQYHFSPQRLSNMHDEVQRRLQNVEPGINTRTANAASLGTGGEVNAGAESAAPNGNRQTLPTEQKAAEITSASEGPAALSTLPPTDTLNPAAQNYAKAVARISLKIGKDAAIDSGRKIAGNAKEPERQQLLAWLDKWESEVSVNELNKRLDMMKDNPLKVIGSAEDRVPERDFTEARKKTLLTVGKDAKTVKGEKIGVMTGILYLAPGDESGIAELCPFRTEGCTRGCLFTAGRAGIFPSINQRRIERTEQFKFDRPAFMKQLSKKIGSIVRKANREGYKPAIRLNGTSDIPWENVKTAEGKSLMDTYPNIQFYDYTKNPNRMDQYIKGDMPKNYHLTFSRSEKNDPQTIEILKNGGNAAVVFDTKRGKPLPTEWNGFKVIDGDESDVRFIDGKSTVIGLRAKGKAKKDTTGFVYRIESKK